MYHASGSSGFAGFGISRLSCQCHCSIFSNALFVVKEGLMLARPSLRME